MSENDSEIVGYLIECAMTGEDFFRRSKNDADGVARSLPKPVIVTPLVRGDFETTSTYSPNEVNIPVIYAWVCEQFGGNFPSVDELAVKFYQHCHRADQETTSASKQHFQEVLNAFEKTVRGHSQSGLPYTVTVKRARQQVVDAYDRHDDETSSRTAVVVWKDGKYLFFNGPTWDRENRSDPEWLVTIPLKPVEETSERRRPTGQCSWGCYVSDGKLVKDTACTVHGASENGTS